MADQALQRVFVRVYTYLTEADVEMTRHHCRTLLKLIDDTLTEKDEAAETDKVQGDGVLSETHLLAQAMDRLPAYFPIEEETLPAPNPPLCRGSIGYPARG